MRKLESELVQMSRHELTQDEVDEKCREIVSRLNGQSLCEFFNKHTHLVDSRLQYRGGFKFILHIRVSPETKRYRRK